MRSIKSLAKPYILNLKAYSSARSEYMGETGIWLDANENNLGNAEYGEKFNRYPDPQQSKLKNTLCKGLNSLSPNQIFIGNGSDEALDLLFRVFIEPGKDAVAICSPSYGMYKVLAESHNAELIDVPLNENFQLNVRELKSLPENCKILFLCSPNNPTGNDISVTDLEEVITHFDGIVVLDEAYIHFSDQDSWVNKLAFFSNVLVTQTFSKAHGLAGLRVGMAYASTDIIGLLNKVKLPYNMNSETIRLVQGYLENKNPDSIVERVKKERTRVEAALKTNDNIKEVFASSSNFILFTCANSLKFYDFLKSKNVIIRNRMNDYPNALRVSIGTEVESNLFISLTDSFFAK